jgi:hypothetical protein
MIRTEREITDPEEIREIIAGANVCRLGMCEGERPYVVPVCFGVDGERLYFHCALEGTKLGILRQNPNVCAEFEDVKTELVPSDTPCKTSINYRSVIAFGKAVFVEDPVEIRHGLDTIVRQYGGNPTQYSDGALARTLIIRIDIESITGRKNWKRVTESKGGRGT